MCEVSKALAQRRLALAREAGAEAEADFADPQVGRADQDLEQDLEARGFQLVERDRVSANEEEPAHRVAHRPQPAREEHSGRERRPVRDQRPERVQRRAVTVGGPPARHHEVEIVLEGPLDHLGQQLRWMLQVAVHDRDPLTAGEPESLGDGPAQPTAAFTRGPMMEHDLVWGHATASLDRRWRVVIAVVDKDHLDAGPDCDLGEAIEQRGDVAGFVARRNHDRETRRLLAEALHSAQQF